MQKLHLILLSSIFFQILLIADKCQGAAFLSKWLLSTVGHRRQNPGSLWRCPALPLDMTYCSHAAASSDSVQEANIWIALLSSKCHPQTMKFICTVYNPVCLHSHQVMPILPCREFCYEVRNACISRMHLFGFKWPQQVDCDRFPSEETSMCISSKRESVTCTPCSQEPTREEIIKKYCKADVVVKSQISGVTAYGNASSLLVSLDRISEQLLPQPLVPTPGNPNKLNSYFISSPGFVDTNDDRLLMMSQSGRLDRDFDLNKLPLSEIIPQADQPTDSATVVKPHQLGVTSEISKTEKRKERREKRLLNRAGGKRRRDRRSPNTPVVSPELEGSLKQSLLLECAGCDLQLPTSPMAPNSAARWLVMTKKLNKTRSNLTYPVPSLQIISIMSWQKDVTGFRDAIRDIHTIPRAILCNPNAKVELNLDGFHRGEPSTQQPLPPHQGVRNSWSRQGWIANERLATPPGKLPANFEGLFQNDAAVGNRKTKRPLKQQMQKRRQGQMQNLESSKVSKIQNNIEDDKERKQKRKRARKEMLAKMTPQQRDAWKSRRKARRAQRQMLRGRQRGHRNNNNPTNGSNVSPL
nr:secreted frizzled protein 5 [Hymenolepis microstoma]